MGQRVADVVERALECDTVIPRNIGRSFALRIEGQEYDVYLDLKILRKLG